MDNEDAPSSVNFIPCVKWVKKGVAKQIPEKVQLTEEELQELISQTRTELRNVEEDEDIENKGTEGNPVSDMSDEYQFDKYDDEDTEPNPMLAIGNLTVYSSNSGDPYVTLGEDEGDDSEKEDDIINPEDNLILVGHVEGDTSILEVYVYNEEEGSLYVHHDLLLPGFPLCIEWLNHDPGEQMPGNLCAVGSMSPVIDIWDIDVIECLEPVFKLGHRGNKRKGIAKYGHRDAVLDLSWNTNITHVIASGSADCKVLLWDLNSGKFASTLSFQEKVQTLQWHPFEGQTLLVGSCDKLSRVFDCRVEDSYREWAVNGEVERVLWNHFSPFSFLVGTNSGSIHYIDCRTDRALWELSAHTKEVTGLALSSQCPGMLMTAGRDGKLKTWDILDGKPSLVYEQQQRLGGLLCLDVCPDLPFMACLGGENKKHNFTVVDVMDVPAVKNKFGDRKLMCPAKSGGEVETAGDSIAVETADATIESLTTGTAGEGQPSSSRVTTKTFQSSHFKSGRKKLKMKKKK